MRECEVPAIFYFKEFSGGIVPRNPPPPKKQKKKLLNLAQEFLPKNSFPRDEGRGRWGRVQGMRIAPFSIELHQSSPTATTRDMYVLLFELGA